jgi:hypothetical protein
MSKVFGGMRDHGTGETDPFKFDVSKFRVDPVPDGNCKRGSPSTFRRGYHAIGPEISATSRMDARAAASTTST